MYPDVLMIKIRDNPAIPGIIAGVIALFFLRFWPPGGQAKNQDWTKTGSVSYSYLYSGTCTKFRVNSSSGYKTCPASGNRRRRWMPHDHKGSPGEPKIWLWVFEID
jgi:hypothetical protein